MVFWMIHVKDSLLPMGKVWSLDFLGIYIYIIHFFGSTFFLCKKNNDGSQANATNANLSQHTPTVEQQPSQLFWEARETSKGPTFLKK